MSGLALSLIALPLVCLIFVIFYIFSGNTKDRNFFKLHPISSFWERYPFDTIDKNEFELYAVSETQNLLQIKVDFVKENSEIEAHWLNAAVDSSAELVLNEISYKIHYPSRKLSDFDFETKIFENDQLLAKSRPRHTDPSCLDVVVRDKEFLCFDPLGLSSGSIQFLRPASWCWTNENKEILAVYKYTTTFRASNNRVLALKKNIPQEHKAIIFALIYGTSGRSDNVLSS